MAHPLSRTDVRLGLAALTMVGLVGAGAFLLGGTETGRSLGRTLNIAVVAPAEPEVLPGETMEVGQLNDGFDRTALDRAAEPPMDETLPPPAWIGDEALGDPIPRMPMPTPVAEPRMIEAAAPPYDPLADGSPRFGFDPPRTAPSAEGGRRWERSATTAPANADKPSVQYSSQ